MRSGVCLYSLSVSLLVAVGAVESGQDGAGRELMREVHIRMLTVVLAKLAVGLHASGFGQRCHVLLHFRTWPLDPQIGKFVSKLRNHWTGHRGICVQTGLVHIVVWRHVAQLLLDGLSFVSVVLGRRGVWLGRVLGVVQLMTGTVPQLAIGNLVKQGKWLLITSPMGIDSVVALVQEVVDAGKQVRLGAHGKKMADTEPSDQDRGFC